MERRAAFAPAPLGGAGRGGGSAKNHSPVIHLAGIELLPDLSGALYIPDERTLVAADSRSKDFRAQHRTGGNVAAARAVGTLLAQRAKALGIERVVFDRGGYKYHGRIKALAEAARAGGLAF